MYKQIVIFFLLSNLLFIGCVKKKNWWNNKECKKLRVKAEYIQSQTEDSTNFYSQSDKKLIYKGLKNCKHREINGSKDYKEYERLMNKVNSLLSRADTMNKKFMEMYPTKKRNNNNYHKVRRIE